MSLVQSGSGMIHDARCDLINQGASDHDPLSTAVPVHRDEIDAIGPYSRCRRCDPDVPDYLTPVSTSPKRAGGLGQGDVGRATVLGTIAVIMHGPHRVHVTFDDGIERSFAPAEHLDLITGPDPSPARQALDLRRSHRRH